MIKLVNLELKQFIPICRILKAVDKFSKKEWRLIREHPTEDNREIINIYNFCIERKPPIESEKIKEIAHESIKEPYIFINKPWFYLPPLTGEDMNFLPILYLDCDFREEKREISYRIGMIHIKDIETKPSAETFGFRFEIGHSGSSHAYCHAQITLTPFERGGPILLGLPSYTPQQTPCFPLLAKCPVSLLLAVIISLYGRIKGHEIISDIEISQDYFDLIKRVF